MKTTELTAGLQALAAVDDAIRELGSVPSGQLYGQIVSVIPFEDFSKMLDILKRADLITEDANHIIRWNRPPAANPNEEAKAAFPKGRW